MSTTIIQASARLSGWIVLGLLAGLYAAQSVTGSMVQSSLPVVLRDAGMPLDQIGFLAILFLPWALKFLWAPLVDRYFSERSWILVCQTGITACFLLAMAFPPQTHLMSLAAVLLVMATLAATQDIATDSLAVRATSEETRGAASGASTAGAYLGFLLGGGIWLIVYSHAGWAVSMAAMAGFVVLLSIPVLLSSGLAAPRENTARIGRRLLLRETLSNRTLMTGFVFLAIYQIGLRMGSAMTGPYLVDKGLSLEMIGTLRGAGGALVGFLAAALSALIVQRLGIRKAILAAATINTLLLLALASLEWQTSVSQTVAAGLMVAQVAAIAMSFVALYAAMMNWCDPHRTATDFAVLQSLDAIIAIAASSLAGLLGKAFGYGLLFGASALFILLAMLAAPKFLPAGGRPSSSFPSVEKVSQS
ncbi:MFS transporter [Rhizobiales bacterium RZME27]|uniref:MFS transporter n=1 Tax=Endobacterium cereale TaxID=2663029 RepID=A0A6A8AEL0_9HYPH|nr:MFS transporter [Endobacterium cereale]MEB2847358.1 MFS transporter [Endobacterium cereale]MQY49209.1 MFS transporter [Endobacterium cereale]